MKNSRNLLLQKAARFWFRQVPGSNPWPGPSYPYF